MRRFDSLGKEKAVLGMLHLRPMPGTPFYVEGSYEETMQIAVEDAVALAEGGATGCLVQTVDRVYTTDNTSDPARIAAVSNIVHEIDKATQDGFQIGVQLMRNAINPSVAIAKVSNGTYVRCGAIVGATLSTHGWVEPNPLEVMTYRRQIGAEHIRIIAEVDSMHYKWFGGAAVADVARQAKYVGADAVSLGDPDDEVTLRMIADVRAAVPGIPIILAGYTNHGNAAKMLAAADGAFVGTCLEKGGWAGRIDVERVREYVDIVNQIVN
ncbi:MAG: hypothetical protein KC435_02330 [Thermomicrobiales bacterium]|nr:hypothetical protein [Thermomicrobiales bacterium]